MATPDKSKIRESRNVQVKAAVTPTEKRLVEELARRRNVKVSALIYDFLMTELRRSGLR